MSSSTSWDRDFNEDEKFHVGSVWAFASHQFRRSLACYAASSGFVKLPTLNRQFKHLTLAMTRYYSRNFKMLIRFSVATTKKRKSLTYQVAKLKAELAKHSNVTRLPFINKD